jgi:hypothetical protein
MMGSGSLETERGTISLNGSALPKVNELSFLPPEECNLWPLETFSEYVFDHIRISPLLGIWDSADPATPSIQRFGK